MGNMPCLDCGSSDVEYVASDLVNKVRKGVEALPRHGMVYKHYTCHGEPHCTRQIGETPDGEYVKLDDVIAMLNDAGLTAQMTPTKEEDE